MTISFISDDLEAANAYLKTLSPEILNQRFSSTSLWNPKHLELVLMNDVPVALADCTLESGDDGMLYSQVGFISSPNFGAYAVIALLRMKNRVRSNIWIATIKNPSEAILLICRRYVDKVFDQLASDVRSFGYRVAPNFPACDIPLTTSHSTLKEYGLVSLKDVPLLFSNKILLAALNPSLERVIAPNGTVITREDTISLAFDLLDIPIVARQHFVRRMSSMSLIPALSMGLDPQILKSIEINHVLANSFLKKLQRALGSKVTRGLRITK